MCASTAQGRRRASGTYLAGGAAVLYALLTGCQLFGGGTGDPGGQALGPGSAAPPLQHQMLEGIPVPVGFRMIPAHSTIQVIGTTRVGRCEFEGATAPDATARFYLEQMPAARFSLDLKRLDAGEYTLRFDSDSEECTIRLKPVKDTTVLIIDIGPLAKGSAEREAAVPARRPPPGTKSQP